MASSLDPRAFSADGYLIDQSRTAAIPYGRLSSDINGCGWIAAYNFMKAMGPPADGDEAPSALPAPEDVAQALAAGSPFRCLLGTGRRRLRRWLQGRGYPMRATARRGRMAALATGARAGILFYVEGHEPHFVAFAAQPGGLPRFFNAAQGQLDFQATLADFLRLRARFPVVYLMVSP